jgi:hypothetical protein
MQERVCFSISSKNKNNKYLMKLGFFRQSFFFILCVLVVLLYIIYTLIFDQRLNLSRERERAHCKTKKIQNSVWISPREKKNSPLVFSCCIFNIINKSLNLRINITVTIFFLFLYQKIFPTQFYSS